jgi:hypothetical protein
MGAPVGGSMAFEVKCGKAEYLYSQKDHMIFRPKGTSKQMRNALFAHETSTICQKKNRKNCAMPARSWLTYGGNVAKEK